MRTCRTRLVHAIDALTLVKLFVVAIGAFVGTASPLYAVGIVFWLPIIAAGVLFLLRWLGVGRIDHRLELGAFGHALGAPPARLGLPLSAKLARSAAVHADTCGRSGRVTSPGFGRFGR